MNRIADTVSVLAQREIVAIDTVVVQTYKGVYGIWLPVTPGLTVPKMVQRFGSDPELLRALNSIPDSVSVLSGRQYRFIPFGADYLKLILEKNGRPAIETAKGEFIWPIQGYRITSRIGRRWGRNHTGLDIAAGIGTVVVAVQDGTVRASGNRDAYGIVVELQHDGEYSSLYAHLSATFVQPGEQVRKGQIIGLSGNTGRSTGPHLHFEVRCLGMVLDPEPFLPTFDQGMAAFIPASEAAAGPDSVLREKSLPTP